jgi:alkanesulfonate monooxygenase SsuD/methylene tetrahydromethanopterin reductase-like flavin-dependent oxidoreductase (luciferase family)
MDVGLYFDLRNPAAWRRDFAHVYGTVLALCEEAERLGAASVWVTEHHLFDDGYLPQPLTVAAAIAARTRRVRIGTAVLLPALYHPVHLAEQAAVVDILSGGRLDLGVGAGYRKPEYDLFGADHARRLALTFERVRQLREIWADGRVTPPPVQERLPIWVGSGSPASAARTGRLGEGLLRIAPELVEPYRAGLAAGGHDPASARIAGPANVLLSDDPERDWPRVAPHVEHQWTSYKRHGAEGTGRPPPPPEDPDAWRARGLTQGATSGFFFGTPEQAAAAIRAFAGPVPAESIFVWGTLGGLPEDLAARNVELVCTRLAPLLRGATA